MSPERETLKAAFLARAGLATARRQPLPGDASTRRYERLTGSDGSSLLLMDAPPLAESPPCDPAWSPKQRLAAGWNATARLAAGSVTAFAAVADHLRSWACQRRWFTPWTPRLAWPWWRTSATEPLARLIARGAEETELYIAAIDARPSCTRARRRRCCRARPDPGRC